MVLRLTVEKVYDLPSRDGLLVSGYVLNGTVEEGVVFANPEGARSTVLGVEFDNPRDRATGQITVEMERTSPSPIVRGEVLAAVSTPADAVRYDYTVIYPPGPAGAPAMALVCAENGSARPRAVVFTARLGRWIFDSAIVGTLAAGPHGDGKIDPDDDKVRRISAQEAEAVARGDLRTYLPSKSDLRSMILRGEADEILREQTERRAAAAPETPGGTAHQA